MKDRKIWTIYARIETNYTKCASKCQYSFQVPYHTKIRAYFRKITPKYLPIFVADVTEIQVTYKFPENSDYD